MQLTIRQRWIGLLGQVADRPRASAIAATVLLALFAALIRPPVIQGSMLDQIPSSNMRLEIERRITAASGGTTLTAVIVAPREVSVSDVFGDLDKLRAELARLDRRIDMRSVDAVREQLFVYDLGGEDPVASLLGALRDSPQAATAVSGDARRFLIVLSSPASLEVELLRVLDAHAWSDVSAEHAVLSSALLERDVAAGLEKDLRLLLPTIVGIILLALYVAYGAWRALLLPLFASVASIVVSFSLFSALGVTINQVTLLALPIVLIVGLANSCHFLAKSAAGSRHDIDTTVRLTLQRVGPPFFFSTLTTAIAVASLGFNELPPIANLGRLSAAALLFVFLLVLLAAPLSLRWFLSRPVGSRQKSRLFAVVSRWLSVWRAHISATLLLAMLAGAVSLPLLTVKSEPAAFIPDAAPFSVALNLFEKEFYAFSPLRALVSVKSDDLLLGIRSAGAIRESLAQHPDVRRASLQPAADANNAFVLSALLASEASLAAVLPVLDAAATGDDIDLVYSSTSLVYGDIDRQALESLLVSLASSVALIFGSILVVFRSFRALLGALLATAVPLMLVCAAVWFIGSPLNLVTVFVFLVALGVVVDDSIHILFWRAAGDSVSGSSIEFSVLLSTLLFCLGLLLCQLSVFPTTRQFAAYCALALVAAVISNLTVLPLLLRARHRPAAAP
jgi:predicted RND superfamily exporter protein